MFIIANHLTKFYPPLRVLTISRHPSNYLTCIISFNPTSNYEVNFMMSILQVRKLKHTEFKGLVCADFLVRKPGEEQGTQNPHLAYDHCSREVTAESIVCIAIVLLCNCNQGHVYVRYRLIQQSFQQVVKYPGLMVQLTSWSLDHSLWVQL